MEARNKGEIGQLQVQIEAVRRGYIVSRPTTDVKYDLLIDCGQKISRIQIKYVGQRKKDKDNKNQITIYLFRNKQYYSLENVDFIFVYLSEKNVILSITPNVFHNKKRIRINLENPDSKYYYKKFIW